MLVKELNYKINNIFIYIIFHQFRLHHKILTTKTFFFMEYKIYSPIMGHIILFEIYYLR